MRLSRSAAVSRTSSAPTCAVLPASCCSSSSSSLAAQPCSGSSTQMLRARGVSEGRKTWQHQQRQHGGRPSVLCRATLDDPDLVELLKKMEALRAPPSDGRPKLQKALQLIDEANSQDPQKVEWEGKQYPYRLLYSQWVSAWVDQLDSNGPDELYILARGRNVQGWKLTDIKRDDYAPNTGGMRQWEMDRKKWQAKRLTDIMKEAGYSDPSCKLAEDFILDKEIPNPRDMRKFDVVGTLGMINYRLLEIVKVAQVLIDADALVFVERSFPRMFANMNAEDVLAMCKREMSRISQKAMVEVLRMDWTPVQRKLLTKAFPAPKRYGEIMGALENVAAASTHPGDWRFRNFDYE